jgi:3-hydroxyacyl-CoA dehydrogenase
MVKTASIVIENEVAFIGMNNPPMNSLSLSLRTNLKSCLEDAIQNDEVKAIVIHGEGKVFSAGADINEFGKPLEAPHLPDICDFIENSNKPIISAIHGTALGGALEIALSTHYRIATPSSKIGLPEVHLGLLPGSAGTQRMPRLVGIKNAIEIMTTGKPVNAKKALDMGALDELIEDLKGGSLTFARKLIVESASLKRLSQINDKVKDTPENTKIIEDQRAFWKRTNPHLEAPQKIIDCVEQAMKTDFSQGMRFEQKSFQELMSNDQSRCLIHAFFAERKSNKIPELKRGAKPRVIEKLGVIGGGTMGSGITIAALNSGIPVTMVERDSESIERGIENVKKIYRRDVERGRLTQEKADSILKNYSTSTNLEDLSDKDMIIEAVFEELDVKKEVFSKLDGIAKPGAVLASNTSYLDIDKIAAATKRTGDVIGLHFFSPANIMRLLEIVVPESVKDDVVATGFQLAKLLRKVPVRAGNCDGFIGNRILENYAKAANYMMEDGASPYEIDKAVVEFGYPMGPFQMFDLAGGDIGWADRKRKAAFRPNQERYVNIADRICEKGWFGQKTGRGYYKYTPEARRGEEDPEVLAIVDEERNVKGVKPRKFTSEEILRRYLAAMVNEGAKVLEENMALRPSDIDVTKLFGYAFPRHKGGPMKYADQYGVDKILSDLREFEKEDPDYWRPANLIVELVDKGQNFDSLN